MKKLFICIITTLIVVVIFFVYGCKGCTDNVTGEVTILEKSVYNPEISKPYKYATKFKSSFGCVYMGYSNEEYQIEEKLLGKDFPKIVSIE